MLTSATSGQKRNEYNPDFSCLFDRTRQADSKYMHESVQKCSLAPLVAKNEKNRIPIFRAYLIELVKLIPNICMSVQKCSLAPLVAKN